MATGGGDDEDSSRRTLVEEFHYWQETIGHDRIVLLQTSVEHTGVCMSFMLTGKFKFKLQCPSGYPNYTDHFYIPEADPAVKLWANAVNELLLDSLQPLTLAQVLKKAASLHSSNQVNSQSNSEDECNMDDDEEMDEIEMPALFRDDLFTTTLELDMARKKKRWAEKEHEIRERLQRPHAGHLASDLSAFQVTGQEKDQAKQIFTSSAASGILTNDLLKILEGGKEAGFTADPIDDNIYQWSVRLFSFLPGSDLDQDLAHMQSKFGYNWIELQLDFAIDLYPFYPPLVKVIRPRLQGSMMQRVTNMEILKLSHWNPTKDMKGILTEVKRFLQQWARLEVESERNDPKRYLHGSYVDIEHHLLRLALVSEVNPRANFKYHADQDQSQDIRSMLSVKSNNSACGGFAGNDHYHTRDGKIRDEYWAAGIGYGHHNRPEWDIRAYVAAQKERDKQIEAVLHKILLELKILYANHAPQLKPRSSHSVGTVSSASSSSASSSEQLTCDSPEGSGVIDIIDPVTDVYNILEGSALIPFAEQYLKTDSFLEICRHTVVYRVLVDIIKEIALQPQLVPLLGQLCDQQESIYQLLSNLEQKANVLLHHICKAGNGCIPKPPKKEGIVVSKRSKDRATSPAEPSVSSSGDMYGAATAEEKLAREFQSLFRDVSEAFRRLNLEQNSDAKRNGCETSTDSDVMDVSVSSEELSLETKYKLVMSELQFLPCSFDIDVPNSHHFAKAFRKQEALSQSQIFRIAQELTSLAISLPLNLSSAIFVRTDDDKLTLMKALITGPEETPYSCGCFQFDIFFPTGYPKIPPLVNLQTTGSGTVRFNPNLYNCGKVCLSLLGTWDGQQGEQWNETTSTILQVLVSIQSLILVPEPYFNEPGYEQEIGTEPGDKHSAEYNLDIRINTIKHAMIGQMQNPSPGFEAVIRSHFYLKKNQILREVEEWNRMCKSTKLDRAIQNLRSELQKLELPPKLVNLLNTPSTIRISDRSNN